MPPERRLAAIMFTDIVGYTALMARDEEAGRRARNRHEEVVRPLVEQYRGQWIEATGDESLSSFSSALDAVNCALALQEEFLGEGDFQIRVGIHLGDVTFEGGRVSGDGVNVAARVRPLAEPGGVTISEEVHHSVQGRSHLEFKPLGRRKLKHVPHRVAIYAVSGEAEPARPRSKAELILAQPELRSIAVLPLENLGNPEHERVADGVTDALIESLARVGSELRVISRTSAMRYKGTHETAREIGRELGVELLVDGTVLREEDQVLVRLELIDAERDAHLWTRSYEREFGGVLRLGKEIARTVAGEIEGVLKPEREPLLAPTQPVDPEALDLFLRARALWGPRSLVVNWGPASIELHERSVELDANFAEGWAGLAHAHFSLLNTSYGAGSRKSGARALEATQRALELDERLGSAHTLLGGVLAGRGDFSGARVACERAVELSPSDPFALGGLMAHLLWIGQGTSPEAELLLERLLRVAPFDLHFREYRFNHFFHTRQYERGLAEVERIRELVAPDFASSDLGMLYALSGRPEDAVREWLAWSERGGAPFDSVRRALQSGNEQGGWQGAVRVWTQLWIEQATQGAPGLAYSVAARLALIGETEDAMAWLERAFAQDEPLLGCTKVDPRFDPLHSDSRFQDLLRRIGFPED